MGVYGLLPLTLQGMKLPDAGFVGLPGLLGLPGSESPMLALTQELMLYNGTERFLFDGGSRCSLSRSNVRCALGHFLQLSRLQYNTQAAPQDIVRRPTFCQ